MKSLLTTTLFVVAGALAAGSAMAQDTGVRAKVPFDFTVGGTLMAPGTYIISFEDSHVVKLWNKDNNRFVLTTVISDHDDPGKTGELIFTRYGDQYFLHKILSSAASMNVDFPASKLEKRVRSEEAKNSTNDQTTIALK